MKSHQVVKCAAVAGGVAAAAGEARGESARLATDWKPAKKRCRLAGLHVSESVRDCEGCDDDGSADGDRRGDNTAASCCWRRRADQRCESDGNAGEMAATSSGERCGLIKRRQNWMSATVAAAALSRTRA